MLNVYANLKESFLTKLKIENRDKFENENNTNNIRNDNTNDDSFLESDFEIPQTNKECLLSSTFININDDINNVIYEEEDIIPEICYKLNKLKKNRAIGLNKIDLYGVFCTYYREKELN